MTRGIRIVAPFRPFPPESDLHKGLADFDWIDAIRMMRHSAELACHCPVHVITDVDTDLPVPTLKYHTTHRRLMLWYIEVAIRYMESPDFDRDTVMVDSDQLIYRNLAPWFTPGVDLGVLIRPTPKHTVMGQPVLNGVQFLAVKGRDRLLAFYRQMLDLAQTLPEESLVWGADTEALRLMLEPLELGLHDRAGARVHMIDFSSVLEAMSTQQIQWLSEGRMPRPSRSVLDFRFKRKPLMRPVYEATIQHAAQDTSQPKPTFVTPQPWHLPKKRSYGDRHTYERAAAWLAPCATVADWGGGGGMFRKFLPPSVRYTLVDGTAQVDGQILADLATYRVPSDGILLRHILDNTPDWQPVLQNALAAFRQRMAVVTFTPDAQETVEVREEAGWPVRYFNPNDLRAMMAPWLVGEEDVRNRHPERVYYLERRRT